MAKGENIFKRKDGRWEARYVKGFDQAGKKKYGYCYGRTYKEAKEKVTECKAAVLRGETPASAPARLYFDSLCDQWLHTARGRLKQSTYVKYSSTIEKHIKPNLGPLLAQSIDSRVIADFADRLQTEAGLSPKSIKDILVTLRSILKFAARQYPGKLPQVDIVYPKDRPKEARVLSREEQNGLINCLLTEMDACKFGILLALSTGLRLGEICALRWGSISLKDKTVKITATMQRLRDTDGENRTRIQVDTPKSGKSYRTIPLTEQTAELCTQMYPNDPEAYVLTGAREYMEPRTLQYRLSKYTGDCGLEGVHFHTLRHTFATRCVEVGFDVKSLSEILGHSTTAITLERYVHASMELKRDNMQKLNALNL